MRPGWQLDLVGRCACDAIYNQKGPVDIAGGKKMTIWGENSADNSQRKWIFDLELLSVGDGVIEASGVDGHCC